MAFNTTKSALSIRNTGVNITTSGVSASSALPTNSSLTAARYILVTATVAAHVRIGLVGLTAVATDVLIPAGQSLLLDCSGATHIAAIQDAAGGVVNVAPLEW